jgi:hypothetical protein
MVIVEEKFPNSYYGEAIDVSDNNILAVGAAQRRC